ncbi:MAG TPA: peptidase, partial [Thiotrichales bacterium]|nr:peptidase [Thiotrichales bacterium]
PALVLSVDDSAVTADKADKKADEAAAVSKPAATVMLKNGEKVSLPWSGIRWARQYVSVNRIGKELKTVSEVIKPGDVIWVEARGFSGWRLAQIPEVQGALVSIDPNSGAIQALTGGLDFQHSKFNRATQAKRQAGSGFKPVIYSAALAKSYTPATLINDAPVVFEDAALEGSWRPENYSGKFYGPTRLRKALYTSRNLVSIRILRSIGVKYAVSFAKNFGFQGSELPHDLSLALGSCEIRPIQMSRAYAVFANGGYLIEPYVIERIEDSNGDVLFEADPAVACTACVLAQNRWSSTPPSGDAEELAEEDTLAGLPKQAARTLEPRLAFQMNSILQDVVLRGTGRRALALGRKDLAGKTGTTNDQRDAWFNGYNPDLVTTVWVGFDQLKPLGNRETASRAALPLWIDFMRVALQGKPEKQLPRPEGLVTVKINADTGEAATDEDTNTIFEIFRKENVPVVKTGGVVTGEKGNEQAPIPEQLF